MASLGAPRTQKFNIGTAEVRVGPMSLANKLTEANSVGLIDNVTVEVSQQAVDLEGGFPRVKVDTAVVSQASKVTAALREFSRRNLKIMLGEGVSASNPVDVEAAVQTGAAAGATSVQLASVTGVTAGDIGVFYPSGSPGKVSVCRITAVNSGTQTLTLDSDTPLLYDVAAGDRFFLGQPVAIGGVAATKYMSVQVIQADRVKGRPTIFNFWKASISSGLNLQMGTAEFASTNLELSILQPAASEYGAGGDLLHLADIIPNHPSGMYIPGADY